MGSARQRAGAYCNFATKLQPHLVVLSRPRVAQTGAHVTPVYIGELRSAGKLIAAQPLIKRTGFVYPR